MIVQECYGRTDRYEIRMDWPVGMVVWNIGRNNFKFPKYIPLCYADANYHVDLNRLVALYVGNEGLCQEVMRVAGRREVDENMFNQIKEKYYENKVSDSGMAQGSEVV